MNKRRLEHLEQTPQQILRALEEHYQPEQVIVFGSLVSVMCPDERSGFIDR